MTEHSPYFSTYSSTIQYLDTRGIFRMNLTQSTIFAVLQELKLQRPPFFVAQVVGTNGKGSTSSMLSSICSAHGLKVGLFTSPHFTTPRERICINGEIINEHEWVKHANIIMQKGGEALSYFELITALALSYFEAEGVDVAVMEAGLGGTWDATSAISSDITVLTSIGLDHCHILGKTLTDIARDKCGAIRKNVPVCSGEQEDEVWQVITKVAANTKLCLSKNQALPSCIEDGSMPMLLQGQFQKKNARLAVCAWNELVQLLTQKSAHKFHANKGSEAILQPTTEPSTPLAASFLLEPTPSPTLCKEGFPPLYCLPESEDLIAKGLARAWIAGRLQQVPSLVRRDNKGESVLWPCLVLDGGHNEHGIRALSQSLAEKNIIPLATVFACLEDKNPGQIIPHIQALTKGLIFVPPIDSQRGIASQVLADMIGSKARATASLNEALRLAIEHVNKELPKIAPHDTAQYVLLICGSLYLLGDFYTLYPDLLLPKAIGM